MKLTLLSLFILALVQETVAQCYATFDNMKEPPPVSPAGYKGVKMEFQYGLTYVAYEKNNLTSRSVIYHFWDGVVWQTLKQTDFQGGAMRLMKWGGRLIGYGNVRSIGNIAAPAGKRIRFAEYKNGTWDTLPGGTKDSLAPMELSVSSTNSGLYSSYGRDSFAQGNKWVIGEIHFYDTLKHQFIKIADYKNRYSPPKLMAGKKKLLIGNSYQINGSSTIGFAYLLGDKLFFLKGAPFLVYDYCIDASDDHIYALCIGQGLYRPFVDEYDENLVSSSRTTSDLSSGEGLLALNGTLILPNGNNFKVLCRGEKVWMDLYNNSYYESNKDNILISGNGFYVHKVPIGLMLELNPGAIITGKVFLDLNADCIYDKSADSVLRNHRVETTVNKINFVRNSSSDGTYRFVLPVGSSKFYPEKYDVTCLKSVVMPKGDSTYLYDIAVPKPKVYDLSIHTSAPKLVRWNSKINYQVTIRNNGLSADSAYFEFKLDRKLRILPFKDPQIKIDGANVISGQLKNLGYFEKRTINVEAIVDSFMTKPDSFLVNSLSAYLFKGEHDSSNNVAGFVQKVVYSLDPNHIECDKDSIPEKYPSFLKYRIDFQNEGKGDAFDVKLSAGLPSQLDISTITDVEASHPYAMFINGTSMKFEFWDINLKPKDSSEILSKGYVKFRITSTAGLREGTRILNNASIYFDLNSPVTTNMCSVLVNDPQQSVNIAKKVALPSKLVISPNPANVSVSIDLPSFGDIFIYDLAGRLVYSEKADSKVIIDVSRWHTGLYFVRCGNLSGKFIRTE